ncbi:MAG TPA: histidine phosphatase family protein [Actinomycetota bacterium]
MARRGQRIVLIRHGETEWSASGRHTSRTDVPLTDQGRRQAEALGACLKDWRFDVVLTSPLQRAVETCRVAGLGDVADVRRELMEWDYGDYEGRTTPEIRTERPGWTLWSDGVLGGESAEQVGARADGILAEARGAEGDVALFSHGHFLRVMAARWIGLPPQGGRSLALDTATISVLGHERETPVIVRWNQPC